MSQSGQSREANSITPTHKQKMIEKLKELGFWYEGMADDLMKDTFNTIKESQAKANNSPQGVTENKSPETAPSAQISYARATKSSSPLLHDRKSSSPELIQRNHSQSQEKHPESQEDKFCSLSNKNSYKAKNDQMTNMNKNRANPENSPEITNENKRANHRQNLQSKQDDKIAKFRINPLDFLDNKNDAPLVPHHRKFRNEDCNEGNDSAKSTTENVDKAIAQVSNHLHCIAEIWHNQQRSSDYRAFEWGPAIKVGVAIGSLDRKENADEESKTIENTDQSIETIVGGSDASTRRRRNCTMMKSAIYDYDSENENSDDIFQICPKRKKTAAKTISTPRSTRVKSVEPMERREESTDNSVSIEKSSKAMTTCIDVSDEFSDGTDDETSQEPPKKVQRCKSEETANLVYPRRVIPPNPHRKWLGISSRRPLHVDQTSQSRITKQKLDDSKKDEISRNVERNENNLGLKDTEIAKELEKDDADGIDDDDDDYVGRIPSDIEVATELRPLRISSRVKLGIQRLMQSQEEEKQAEEIQREHERIKEEVISRKKQERVAKRIREEADKLKREERMEMEKLKREEQWKIITAQTTKERPVARTELFPDGLPRNSVATSNIEEQHFGMESQNKGEIISDNGRGRESKIEHVSCPICNKAFTTDEIEAHAAACEEFEAASSSGASRSNSPTFSVKMIKSSKRKNPNKLDCDVCSNFTSTNGKEYEDHVTECIERQRGGHNSGLRTIVEVPSSPIRTVRPISEQTDSEIDYKRQFAPKTKSNKNIGRKRKR